MRGTLGWRQAEPTYTRSSQGVSSPTQRIVEYGCTGTTGTTSSGTTLGTMVHRGKTYYARVYMPQAKLACRV